MATTTTLSRSLTVAARASKEGRIPYHPNTNNKVPTSYPYINVMHYQKRFYARKYHGKIIPSIEIMITRARIPKDDDLVHRFPTIIVMIIVMAIVAIDRDLYPTNHLIVFVLTT